jgi:predicted Na+-dependent transporter
LGFLVSDFSVVKKEITGWKYHCYLLFLGMIVAPVCSYYFALLLSHLLGVGSSFAATILLVIAAPTAMVSPILCMLLGGVLERAQLNVILTTIVVIVSMPLLCYLLLGKAVSIDVKTLGSFLMIVIMIPLVAAIFVRRVAPGVVKKIGGFVPSASVLLLAVIIFASAEKIRSLIISYPNIIFHAFLLAALCYLFVFALGWVLAFKKERAAKITSALVTSWTNMSLAIMLVDRFLRYYHPQAMLYVLIFAIVWALALIPTRILLVKRS